MSFTPNITINATPKKIFADGKSTSKIIITVVDDTYTQIPAPYDLEVALNTTFGTLKDDKILIKKGKEIYEYINH